jgi:hypothetical protein
MTVQMGGQPGYDCSDGWSTRLLGVSTRLDEAMLQFYTNEQEGNQKGEVKRHTHSQANIMKNTQANNRAKSAQHSSKAA